MIRKKSFIHIALNDEKRNKRTGEAIIRAQSPASKSQNSVGHLPAGEQLFFRAETKAIKPSGRFQIIGQHKLMNLFCTRFEAGRI